MFGLYAAAISTVASIIFLQNSKTWKLISKDEQRGRSFGGDILLSSVLLLDDVGEVELVEVDEDCPPSKTHSYRYICMYTYL